VNSLELVVGASGMVGAIDDDVPTIREPLATKV